MPRKKRPPIIPKNSGVPKKLIDWDRVERGLAAQLPVIELAAIQGVSVDTLYDRCITDRGVSFSEYRQSKKASGLGYLREKQYAKAMNGSDTMLTLLGKEFLDQGNRGQVEDFHNLIRLREASKSGKLKEYFTQPETLEELQAQDEPIDE